MLRLLLASDGSPGSLRAADWISTKFSPNDLQLRVASVSRHPVDVGSPVIAALPDYAGSLEDPALQEAQEACHRTQEHLRAFPGPAVILSGQTIVTALLNYAADHPFDALVAGRRSQAGVARLLGSISSELAAHSPIPVWIIP